MQPVTQPSIASYETPVAEPTPAPPQRQLSQEEIEWFAERSAQAAQSPSIIQRLLGQQRR